MDPAYPSGRQLVLVILTGDQGRSDTFKIIAFANKRVVLVITESQLLRNGVLGYWDFRRPSVGECDLSGSGGRVLAEEMRERSKTERLDGSPFAVAFRSKLIQSVCWQRCHPSRRCLRG